MNKFRTLLLCAVALVASSAGMPAFASSSNKGEKTLGISGGYASYNKSAYANVFFQYTFTPHLRIAPEIGYVIRNSDISGFEVSCDMHFPFRLARGFKVYPLAGLTFNTWNNRTEGNLNRFGGDLGLGFDLYITGSLKLCLQGKYSLMKSTSGAFASLSIGYVF